jgi:hypothetical protein
MDEEVDRINNPNNKRDLTARFVSLIAGCERIGEIAQTKNAKTINNEIQGIHAQLFREFDFSRLCILQIY